jgi:hypothetical protein
LRSTALLRAAVSKGEGLVAALPVAEEEEQGGDVGLLNQQVTLEMQARVGPGSVCSLADVEGLVELSARLVARRRSVPW